MTRCEIQNAPRSERPCLVLTHGCHPLRGAELVSLEGPKSQSAVWVYVEFPGGTRRMIRKAWTSLAAPDPYPLTGGPVKIESKAPEYIDLAARLKAALTAPRAPSTRPSPTSPGRTSR